MKYLQLPWTGARGGKCWYTTISYVLDIFIRFLWILTSRSKQLQWSNRPGTFSKSFHVIFLRILIRQNVFVSSPIIISIILQTVRFSRVSIACRERERGVWKKDLFSWDKPQANIFFHGLEFCCRKKQNLTKPLDS